MAALRRVIKYLVLAAMGYASIGFAGADQTSGVNGQASAAPAAETLQEIVVTAEKRRSTVQTTPISITALSGQNMRDLGLSNAQAITQAVPGVAVASAGPGEAQYEIRGVSAAGGEAPTVGFYVDEIPVTPPIGSTIGKSEIDPSLYDLDRVEVLRGPQGTLYGAGSMGGTIKLISGLPDSSGVHSSSQSLISDTQGGSLNFGQRAMLNLPLEKDVLALRLVGSYEHKSGWIDRVVVPGFPLETNPDPNFPVYGTQRGSVAGVPGSQKFRNVNDESDTSGRASLRLTPSEQLSIGLAIMYQNITQGGMNTYDSSPGTLTHYEPFNIAEPFSDRFTLASLTVKYEFDAFTLTSATGYWTRRSTQIQDASEVTQNIFQIPAYSTADGGLGPVGAHEFDDTRQLSQELRLASSESARVQWLLGAFYSDYKWSMDIGATAPTLLSSPAPIFPSDTIVQINQAEPVRQSALFGNLAYPITDQLKLTVGGRYYHYTNTADVATSGVIFGTDIPTLTRSVASTSGFNPMANLSYALTANSLYYVTAAKGFREGAGNPPLPGGPVGQQCQSDLAALGLSSVPPMYDPDQVWSYELGEKARLFEGRMIVNGDVYLLNWSNVQTPVNLPCGLPFVSNAGQAHITGGEIELKALLLPHLTWTQNFGYSHAYFTEDVPDAVVMKGQSLFNVPRWTVNTELRLECPLLNDLRGTLTATNSYVSSQTDLTYAINTVTSRNLVGLRMGVEGASWSVELFADNLLDRHYAIENINLLSFTGPPYNRVVNNQPRTVGVTLDLKF